MDSRFCHCPDRNRFSRIVLGALILFTVACDRVPEIEAFAGSQQGTTYHIKVVMADRKGDRERIQKKIDEIFDRVDRALSTYREDSEIAGFNRSRSTDWIRLSPELVGLVALSKSVSVKTQGCFDPTVKPLFDLWGFSRLGPQKVPDEAEIQSVLKHVGMTGIEVDLPGSRLRKQDPDLELDLSSIGQGYTVGVISRQLEDWGFNDYLVEVGGELKVRGLKPQGEHWRVAIEKPTPFKEQVQELIDIREVLGTAIMTAGTYRHFFEQEGQVYSHILDPRVGRPVTHSLLSVTVLNEDPTLADLWDTALLCVGEDEALKLADAEGLKVLLISDHGHQLVERFSRAFLDDQTQGFQMIPTGAH